SAPERLYAGPVHANPNGGWYMPGSRMLFVPSLGLWVAQTPIVMRLDSQGVVTSIQDLAPAGSSMQLPILGVGAPGANDVLRLNPSGNVLWSAPFPFSVNQFTSAGFAPSGDVLVSAGLTGPQTMNVAGWSAGGASLFQHGLPNPSPTSVSAISPSGDI